MISFERKFRSFAQTFQYQDMTCRAVRLKDRELYLCATTLSLFRRAEEESSDEDMLRAFDDVRHGWYKEVEGQVVAFGETEDEKVCLLLAFRHALSWGDAAYSSYKWEMYRGDAGKTFWELFARINEKEKESRAGSDDRAWAVNGTGLADAVDLGAEDAVRIFVASGFRAFGKEQIIFTAALKSSAVFSAVKPLLTDTEIIFEDEVFSSRKVFEALTERPVNELRDVVAFVDSLSRHPGILLQVAAKCGVLSAVVSDLPRLKLLLELGVNPNPPDCLCTDSMAHSALHRAVESDSQEAIRLLLDAGANPNSGDIYGSVCTCALKDKDLQVLKLLLAYGAEIDFDSNWKGRVKSPMRIALDSKDYDLARKLISLGSDPDLVTLGEAYYQDEVKVCDLPDDLRPLFERRNRVIIPLGKYYWEGEFHNPYMGRTAESVFWAGEKDSWAEWSDASVALAWARRAYVTAKESGSLPDWLTKADQTVHEKILLYWIYLNYCNRQVWPECLAAKWSARYLIARENHFWREPPSCGRLIDWPSYWRLMPSRPRMKVVVGDLATATADVIVNGTGESLTSTGGAAGALHKAAGPTLMAAVKKLPLDSAGVRCPVGEIRATKAGKLSAKVVVHTVGPQYKDGSWGEPIALANCYRRSCEYAVEHGMKSIAFSCISTGKRGYPFEDAAHIAVSEVRKALRFHLDVEAVFFIDSKLPDSSAFKSIYEKLIGDGDTIQSR